MALVKEFDESAGETLVRVIERIRDEVTGILMRDHRGHSVDLAMCITELENARLRAINYGLNQNSYILVDKREYVKALQDTEELANQRMITR